MRFYNRIRELKKLRQMERDAQSSSKMTVLVGRRRIGKTKLVKEAFAEKVYLFISRKSEALLCEEFIGVIEASLQKKVLGTFTSFPMLFEYLMELSITTPFTLVIDEFQELSRVNPSIYSELQRVWDEYKDRGRLNLVVSGSIYSLMKRIFEDQREPLFGRADCTLHLKPFDVLTLKEILVEEQGLEGPEALNSDDLLSLYMITGGVAKYVELLIDAKAFTREAQLSLVFEEFSPFIEEGKNLLIEELGKEHTMYFSILSLIASSKTSRPEIESILGRTVGGYLDRLEVDYSLIKRVRPILSKPHSRTIKYQISDNFLNFWFRFIDKHKSAIELENYEYVRRIVDREYATYSGRVLERYFHELFKLSASYSELGSYWERGNQNEIDLVAVNDEERLVVIVEVKRQATRINLSSLETKAQRLLARFKGYEVRYEGRSLGDM